MNISTFHTGNCTNVVACQSIFLGEMSYIGKLEGTNTNGKIETGYHIRMKGIPTDRVTSKAEEIKITPFELYEKLYNSEEVEFDITKGHVKFVFNSNYTIATRRHFIRKVKF